MIRNGQRCWCSAAWRRENPRNHQDACVAKWNALKRKARATAMTRGILIVLLLPTSALAQEAITLTKPVVTTTTLTGWTPKSLTMSVAPTASIEVVLLDSQGKEALFRYPCPLAPPEEACSTTTNAQVQTLITSLNTANLTTRSLWRRIMDRLVADFPARFPGGATVQ